MKNSRETTVPPELTKRIAETSMSSPLLLVRINPDVPAAKILCTNVGSNLTESDMTSSLTFGNALRNSVSS